MAGRKWKKAYGADGLAGKILKHPTGAGPATADGCCCFLYCYDCPYGTAELGWPVSDPIVDTLYARITAVEGCECLDGLCVTLNWYGINGHSGGGWAGTLAIPCELFPVEDRFITFGLQCCQFDALGNPSNTFWLGTDDCTGGAGAGQIPGCPPASGATNHTQAMDSGGSCRPYDMTFSGMPGLTCCGVMPATYDVRITETPC